MYESSSYQIKWVDLSLQTFTNVSIGAILIPPNSTLRTWQTMDTNEAITDWTGFHPAFCSIFAGWIDLPLNISSNHDPYNGATFKATAQAPSPYSQPGLYSFGIKEPGTVNYGVSISKSWAESLFPAISGQNQTILDILIKSSGFFELTEPLPSTSAYYRLPARILSAMIANGMFRSGFSLRPLQSVGSGEWKETSGVDSQFNIQDQKLKRDWIENKNHNLLNLSSSQVVGNYELIIYTTVDGLAYTTNGVPTKIALVIVSIYALYISMFMVGTVVNGRSSSSWDSVAKLVVLAMQSRPSGRLEGTSAGIEGMGIFREPISVGVRDEKIQIVFRSEEDVDGDVLESVREDKAY